jgi:phosphatidylinositol glycan class W
MDVGVGSFVFSLGLVSSRTGRSTKGSPLAANVKAIKKAIPVLALGLVRILMVKGSEYPVSSTLVPTICSC